MQAFIHDNFLLQSETAQRLYHRFAAHLPIIDYHCHMSPQEIAEDMQFENLSQIWLAGDHSKWRLMRANGVAEKYITGDVSDWEKFEKWAETVPYTVRNPWFQWTQMELKRWFGIDTMLNKDTAKEIWNVTCEMLKGPEFSTQKLLEKAAVEVVCTTDDPIDSLEWHMQLKDSACKTKVLPTWRPDKAMAVDNPQTYNAYLHKLSELVAFPIDKFEDLLSALQVRHDFFETLGCCLSDHGIERFYADSYNQSEVDDAFCKVRKGSRLSEQEASCLKSALLYELAIMDDAKGWTQQFHVGAIRNTNTRMMNYWGADAGCDSIYDDIVAGDLAKFMDRLDAEDKLTKTILYNLNPSHNEVYATMIGNFQDGTVRGKIQWGSGWWFLDQKDGMEKQLNALSNMGMLSCFVGMLTDSRSVLNYIRHEYFRRTLCNLIAQDVDQGLIPDDDNLLQDVIEKISYRNAKEYFKF